MFVVHQDWLCCHRVFSHFVICLLVTTSLVASREKQTLDIDFNNITDGVTSPQAGRLHQSLFGDKNQSIVNKATFNSVESRGVSTHLLAESSTERPTPPSTHAITGSSRSPLNQRSTFSSYTKTARQTTEVGTSKKTSPAADHSVGSSIPLSSVQPSTSTVTHFEMGTTESGDAGLLNCEKYRNFTEMFNLCDSAQNLDSHHSCKGRCGQVLSFGEAIENCSCDVKCLAYHDCCVDFSLQCPDLFSHSQGQESLLSYCVGINLVPYKAIITIMSGADVTSPVTTSFWSTPPTSRWSSISSHINITGLEHYSRHYTLVADLTSGLVYADLTAYNNHNAGTDSTPYFLPYVLPLTGAYVAGESIESYVFPHSPHFYYDPYILRVDPLLRACFNDETIVCSVCSETAQIKLTRLCHALRTQNYHESNVEFDPYTPGRERTKLNHHGSCSHYVPDQVFTFYWTKQLQYTTDYVSPSPSSWIAARRQYEETVKKLGAVVTIRRSSFTSSEYILEFEGAPWKTIRCSDPSLSLDECNVKECSRGYDLTQGKRCIQPTSIEVYIETKKPKEKENCEKMVEQEIMPPCLCFAAYTAIKDIKIWNLGKLHRNDTDCAYEIIKVLSSDDQENGAEMVKFQEVFKHVFRQHMLACTEQYHSISTCFKYHNIAEPRCFTFAYHEISGSAVSSGPRSRRLNGTFEVVTLMFVYQYCRLLISSNYE